MNLAEQSHGLQVRLTRDRHSGHFDLVTDMDIAGRCLACHWSSAATARSGRPGIWLDTRPHSQEGLGYVGARLGLGWG